MHKKNILLLSLIIGELVVILITGGIIFFRQSGYRVLGIAVETKIQSNDLIFPESAGFKYFYELAPNTVIDYQAAWLRNKVITSTNNDGLNSLKNYLIDKPTDTFRIIALGDSFTQGVYLNNTDNYVSRLEDRLNGESKCKNINNFEVLNLGVGGYDIEYAAHRFYIRGAKYNPDLVIWFVHDWNFWHLNNDFIGRAKEIENDKSNKNDKNTALDSWSQAINETIAKYGKENIFNYEMDKLINFRQKYNGPVLFIGSKSPDMQYSTSLQMLTIRYLLTYLLPDLTFEGRLPDNHPNAAGHMQIADKIYDFIIKSKLIPCK